MKAWTRFDLSWILVILLTAYAVAPLTYPGFFEVQSGFLAAFNLEHLSDAPDWGRLAGPIQGEGKLPYLLIWPFFQLSGSGVTAIKWGYGLSFLLGALGIYAWTRPWLGVKGGVLAAVVYTYLPWHLSAVYVRGAYAEAWLWAFWPYVLGALDRLSEVRPRSTLVAIAIGLPLLAATFWTQPGLAALATILFIAYGATVPTRHPWPVLRLVEVMALLLLLLLLVARRLSEAPSFLSKDFVYPFQLLSAAWGDGDSFQLGVAAVGLSIVAVALWLSGKGKSSLEETEELSSSSPLLSFPSTLLTRAVWFWVGTILTLILLCLPLSAWLWQVTGFHAFLATPWQLLALTGLPLAFLSGTVIRLDRRLATLPAWAGLVALVVLASYPYLAPRFTQVDPGPEPVALFQPVGADEPQLMILDHEIAPPSEITPTLTLTLTWQALEPVVDDYTVFVHVLTEDDTKVAQSDTRPCDGECPTSSWRPGELIVDRYQLSLAPRVGEQPAHLPSGPYRLAVSLYLLDTGDRATVVSRDDSTVILNVP